MCGECDVQCVVCSVFDQCDVQSLHYIGIIGITIIDVFGWYLPVRK